MKLFTGKTVEELIAKTPKIMKNFYSVLAFILGFSVVNAQETHFCASDFAQKSYINKHPEAKGLFKSAEKLIQKNIVNGLIYKSGEEVYKIPVVVHVMHLGEAVGDGNNISDAQIQSGMNQLNAAFRNESGLGIDMGIEFGLAIQDPNGEATTGIIRYDASGLGDYSTGGISLGGDGVDEVTLKAASKWPKDQYYNIWIVSEINGNDGGFGTQGFAYLPGASATYDGTVIQNTAWGSVGTINSWNDLGTTIIHELGHALGLYHTFHVQDDADTTANGCPINSDCSTQGDLCCDTDPHKVSASFTCDTAEINECTGSPLGNVVRNYMDYSDQECQVMFSADQKARMRATLEGPRNGLLISRGLDNPIAACTNPIAISCEPTSGTLGMSADYTGIMTFEIEDEMISNSSVPRLDGGYLDNTGSCVLTSFLSLDSTYKFKFNLHGTNNSYLKAWIDYDNSGTFDAGELVYDELNIGGADDSANVTIPNDAVIDQFLRLRVMIELLTEPSDACHDPEYGQAEDYTVFFYDPELITSTSIEETIGVHNLSIFPNPTSDLINVKFDYSGTDENITLLIHDISGKLVKNITINKALSINTQINVSDLNAGIYNVSIRNKNGQTNQNFIVK